MAVNASSLFNRDELSYRKMLDEGGILVGDKWFGKNSSEVERAKYRIVSLRRQERNRRRRDRRKAKSLGSGLKRRNPYCPILLDSESQRANRMRLERRKCSRRSTISECPTANELRTAWHYRNLSVKNRVRLGGMLMDLECYVDNSLITIVRRGLLKIVGRRGGLKYWIRENCPELEPHYKTLQRIKGIAKRLRQHLDVLDPMPVSVLLNERLSESDFSGVTVHVQPRCGSTSPVVNRFAWELSPVKVDADGRQYRDNENYEKARCEIQASFPSHFVGYRSLFKIAISLKGEEKCTNETYSKTVAGMDGVWMEMVRDIGRNPGVLADMGRDMMADIARGARETFLPERTNERIRAREKVGVGRVLLDVLEAYRKNIYEPCLVYTWLRG